MVNSNGNVCAIFVRHACLNKYVKQILFACKSLNEPMRNWADLQALDQAEKKLKVWLWIFLQEILQILNDNCQC